MTVSKILLVTLLLACSALVGCGSDSATGDTSGGTGGVTSSGVQGQVTRSPINPVTQDGANNSAPLAGAVIAVQGLDGREVARATSDANGNYRVFVSVGTYQVVGLPTSGSSFPTPPAPQNVTVSPNQFSTVNLDYDTGIR